MSAIRKTCAIALCLLAVCATALAAPLKIASINIGQSARPGGSTVIGTATLTGNAPNNGAVVTLTSSNTAIATVPATVTVQPGAASANFTITTFPVAANTGALITGTYNKSSASAQVIVEAPILTYFGPRPSEVHAPDSTSLFIGLNGNAAVPITVTLASSNTSVAQVPPSAVIAAGSSSVNVNVTTSFVSSSQVVTLTGTQDASHVMTATLTVDPCQPTVASPIFSYNATDLTWFDDALPSGATMTNGSWTNFQRASGMLSIATAAASGYHQTLINSPSSTMPMHNGENTITYLLTNNCAPAREILLGWHTAAGVWKKAYFGQALIGGEGSAVSLGAVPAPGTWGRVEVPVASLGLDGALVDQFSVELYDGQVWFDRLGKTCNLPLVTAPSVPGTDLIWMDDAAPAGANDTWAWDTSQHATGTKSIRLGSGTGATHTEILGATTTMPVLVGDRVVFYLLLNPCMSPTEVMVRWRTTWWDMHGLWWGTSHDIGESGSVYMGAMPAAGQWIRVEVPASQLGLEERNVSGVILDVYDGEAWFDTFGTLGVGCSPAIAPAPSPLDGGTTIWFDDGLPAGASAPLAVWDPIEKASGSQSIHIPYSPGTGIRDLHMTGATATLHTAIGETLSGEILIDECVPGTGVTLLFHTTAGELKGVYWGQMVNTYNWDPNAPTSTVISLGPMPAAGAWTAFNIPVADIGIANRDIDGVFFCPNGHAWLDHVGKYGTACTPPPATQPSVPAGDTVWFDDALPSGGYSNLVWDSTQAATGSSSWTLAQAGSGEHYLYILGFSSDIVTGDKLVAYIQPNPCAPPSEIALQWGTTVYDYRGVYWGTPHSIGEGTSLVSMGPVPTPGVWTRVEIPASQLGLEAKTINAFYCFTFDGQAWFDHAGKTQ